MTAMIIDSGLLETRITKALSSGLYKGRKEDTE